ncbi:MAG: proteasome assembly chaperone family protein [Thermoplasmata archaeon]
MKSGIGWFRLRRNLDESIHELRCFSYVYKRWWYVGAKVHQMEEVVIKLTKKPKLKNPIFLEGLPGIGSVGKISGEYIKNSLKVVKFGTIISKHFPPQVFLREDGTVRIVDNELFYYKGKERDVVLLVGDYQGLTPEGQYEITDKLLSLLQSFHVKEIYTVGGYGVGRFVEKPRVFGAATKPEIVENLKKYNVIFSREEPGGGIVGTIGLLVGLCSDYGMDGLCLMGETPGFYDDPVAAYSVLSVLVPYLNLDVNLEPLKKLSEDTLERLKQMPFEPKHGKESPLPTSEDLSYIG